MKVTVSISLDLDVAMELKKIENKSELVNRLLRKELFGDDR